MSKRIVTAYWLIPTEPAHSHFQNVINDLAQRYDAPTFEPHVTVHVGADCTDTVDGVLSRAAQGCEQVVLQALEVSNSSEFIKTLFVQFATNTQLQQLHRNIRAATQDSSDYQVNPHLSLLYKEMSIRDRCLLARSIEVPFPEVAFDSLKAVRCISPTESRADIQAWRVLATQKLSG
jgi:2'-5' RNA ligase